MKLRSFLVLLMLSLPWSSPGCGSADAPPSPQQIEELRQQQIRQSEAFHNNK
jgi:hypothetical protein